VHCLLDMVMQRIQTSVDNQRLINKDPSIDLDKPPEQNAYNCQYC
jgi:hypothetical protein